MQREIKGVWAIFLLGFFISERYTFPKSGIRAVHEGAAFPNGRLDRLIRFHPADELVEIKRASELWAVWPDDQREEAHVWRQRIAETQKIIF